MDTIKLGNALKLLRNSKNLTIEVVATAIGTTRNTLTLYEKDASAMDFGIFRKLLNYYKIDTHYFFANVYDNSLMKDPNQIESEE